MPGKSLNEWNCTQEGDFSLANELTGKQSREALQNQCGKRKTRGLSQLKNRQLSAISVIYGYYDAIDAILTQLF